MKNLLIVCCYILLCQITSGQISNTVAVITYNNPTEGYNLVYPHNQPNVYLLNNCGEIVHVWEDDEDFSPGNISYLKEDGVLVKAKKPSEFDQETFGAGGGGGIIEWRTWNNELIHSFSFMDSQYRAHHDLALLPNGNVLAIIWERRSIVEVIEKGGDLALHTVDERWPDMVVELDPILDSVVWKWHAWDHLIQEYDSTKLNYGSVTDHPGRININTDLAEFGLRPDWMHINSIDYNADRDQILLSVPNFNEIWVIDHSTTTEEASSSTGGLSGRGGDLLYRWGNPVNYNVGDTLDQKSFFQHDARWELDPDGKSTGRITFFNNRIVEDSSQVNVISPVWESESYLMENSQWLPFESDRIITHPTRGIYSSGLSGAQVLNNGNVLVTVGREGFVFEITPDNNIEWEYKVPLLKGERVDQGRLLALNDNITFRMNRYPLNFPAFSDRELMPNGTIELNPNLSLCTTTPNVNISEPEFTLSVYPNPSSDFIIVEGYASVRQFSLFDISGREVLGGNIPANSKLNISILENGIYWLQIGEDVRKVIKQSF